MVDWVTLVVPFAYLSVLIGSLATFSSLYRKRKARKATSLEPWFPAHLQRDIYFSLLHLDPSSASSKEKEKEKKVPESVLKAALLRRAIEDIKRVLALRSQKQALSMLLQRGSVGDDLWQRFLRAEKEMEEEVRDVVSEANAYVPGWGQAIFQSANEMVNNEIVRERIEKHQKKLDEEKAWWDKKKASIQEGFLKELDAAEKPLPTPSATPAAAVIASEIKKAEENPSVPAPATAVTPAPAAPPAPTVTESDEDAVLVEADADQATAAVQKSPGGGGKKKKKGKK
ncbi:Pre protein translocase subunit Sec66-domain-containing protein [Aspergillus karnatakaensis]|uniref:Sec63 complex subunit SEC66 n=1 Tax=Aspergillus karnatakaensis TaxID=1810916 RepID=UPI003CCCB831